MIGTLLKLWLAVGLAYLAIRYAAVVLLAIYFIVTAHH